MRIGVLHEPQDDRVALVPDVVEKLVSLGNEVWVQNKAGESAYFDDNEFEMAGARVISNAEDILKDAELLVFLQPPEETRWSLINPAAVLVSLFQPFVDPTINSRLEAYDFTVFSLDMVPRTTLAQSMDVLSSMASIAGYRAVIEAAGLIQRYFPMLSTAAGTIPPTKVLILGAGVAGLQAIATAKRLGSVVEAFDTRTAAKEEVQSLGAKFIEIEGATDDKGAGGYAVEQDKEYKDKQRALISEKLAKVDVVITTAQVRGPKAPVLISKEMVELMRPGSVIIDLAASTGGNCELSVEGKLVHHHGISILGDSQLAAKVAYQASELFSKNVFNFLQLLIIEGKFQPDWDNPIIHESCLTKVEVALSKSS